jgi:TIR domain
VEHSQSSNWVVFISHSSIDIWIAKQIAPEIESCGGVPFLDEADIAVGEDFEDRILDALRQAKELLVLLTPWSITRPYVGLRLGLLGAVVYALSVFYTD